MFRPAVLVDGVVVGTWRLVRASRSTPARAEADLVAELVADLPDATRRAIDEVLATTASAS